MLAYLQSLVSLSSQELIIALLVVFIAALVRGFSGFALSALIMAGLALTIPPVSLIPVCFLLEAAASALMIRGGFKQADKSIAWGLAIGSAIGVPIGLAATMNIPADTSRTVALLLILVLAVLQLTKRSPAFLSTRPGLYLSGLVAGMATGLANVGGMVVALYVLAQKAPAERMRATLVMFLFIGMFSSAVWLTLSGLLNSIAIARALLFMPVVILGVTLGSKLFKPSLEQFYKKFCLCLLMLLAAIGILRLMFSS